ncbi:hypothetical protein [Streptomyces sp. NPDC050738]|uniref:hypothetical protein n=1 Tax=Streptomyces sp. NPDC050738 TaxID=3154744 RepID=UPI0034145AD3
MSPGSRTAAWSLLLATLFACLQLTSVSGRATPDTKNYLSYALTLQGDTPRTAATRTITYVCAQSPPPPTGHHTCTAKLTRAISRHGGPRTTSPITPFAGPRFLRIFEVRPGYPLLLAPFIAAAGVTWGVWAAALFVTVTGGLLVVRVLRTLGARPAVAVAGQGLYYALPSGATAMRPMTEGTLMVLTLAVVWGYLLVLRKEKPRRGFALAAAAFAALFAVKHTQALFLGVTLAAALAAVAAVRRRGGRRAGPEVTGLLALAAGAAGATALVAHALHYPSAYDSVQDLLTHHYARPDVPHPWRELAYTEARFWTGWLRHQCLQPLLPVLLAGAGWAAYRRSPVFAAVLAAAACSGVVNQAAHPDSTLWGDRLIVMVWLLPAIGLPLLAEWAGAHRVTSVTGAARHGTDEECTLPPPPPRGAPARTSSSAASSGR